MTDSSPVPEPAKPVDLALSVLATGLGTGFFRWGPGTVGSLLGPALIWALGTDGRRPWLAALGGVVCFLIGIPICNAGIRVLKAKDPKQVVFDEIAAFFWVFLFVPLNPTTGLIGFFLFRFFDILKPWPIRRVERLPGGFGVMADDQLAGMIAGAILGIAWRIISG